MKQQLQKMQEAIDYIRMASDEKLHEICLSLGAKSTKLQAERAREAALEVKRRCRILEEQGEEINTTAAICKWPDEEGDEVGEVTSNKNRRSEGRAL